MKSDNYEGRIKFDKICGYDKSERPVIGDDTASVIGISYTVKYFKYNDYRSMIAVDSWMNLTYTEPKLSWDPKEYGNLEYVIESSSNLWIPEFELYNAHLDHSEPACKVSDCYIMATGQVICVRPCTYKATCLSNLRQWPYDQHNCTINVGMWLIPGDHITYDFDKFSVDPNTTMNHKQFNLVKTEYYSQIAKFSSNETFPSLSFSFIMERSWGIQIVLIISPALSISSILIVFLHKAVVNLIIFFTFLSNDIDKFGLIMVGLQFYGSYNIVFD